MNGRRFAFAAARAVPLFPRRTGAVAAAVTVGGAVISRVGAGVVGGPLEAAGAVCAGGVLAWWSWREVLPSQTSRGAIERRGDREQRAGGVASPLDVAEFAGPAALRRRAGVLRPSLAAVPRRTIRTRDVGVEVARTGLGLWGQRIFVSCEDTTLRIGGPRSGKTLSLICHGLDAPGALITTSTRLDLAESVHPARRDRAVHVFNPSGLGDLDSTVRWSVLVGCRDYSTARRRAADLIPESPAVEGERWDSQARRILGLLLHAAALDGRRVGDVQRWIGDSSDRARGEIIDGLSRLPGASSRIAEIRNHWGTNDRTKSSVDAMISPALAWLSDDRARLIGDADPETITLDVARLVTDRETLHILGQDTAGSVLSPLTSALVAEIAHEARMIAARQPAGRLDPPLTMLLDEAATAVRLPLDGWSADMGGRGITLHMSVQSLAQLRQGWGTAGAATILGNVGALVVFGGGRDADDLTALSILTGEHRGRVVGADHDRDSSRDGEKRGEWRWTPVLSPAQIGALQPAQVLVLRRGLGAVIGRAPSALDRRGWAPLPLAPAPDGQDTAAPVTQAAEQAAP